MLKCVFAESEYTPDSSGACFPPGIQVWSLTETSEIVQILDLENDVSTALSANEVQAGHRQRTRTGIVFSPIEVRVTCCLMFFPLWELHGVQVMGRKLVDQVVFAKKWGFSAVESIQRVEGTKVREISKISKLRCSLQSAFSDVSHQAKPRSAKKVRRSRCYTRAVCSSETKIHMKAEKTRRHN